MIQTINLHDFRQAFHNCGRGEQFSHEALELIFEYLEELEQDTGIPYELDVIALCCDISEMTAQQVRDAYGIEASFPDDKDGDCDDVINYMEYNTSVIGQTDDTIVFFQF
jgi:hypothetical protein